MGGRRESRRAPRAPAVPLAGTYPVWFGEAELVRDRDRPNAWLVEVGGVPQSHVDLDEPTYLAFEYVQHMAHVVDVTARPGEPLDAVHVGGGACTLPRYVAATRPGSGQLVFEPDGGLVELVRERLRLRTVPRLRTRTTDGSTGVRSRRDGSADLVVVDAFSRARMPGELATVEFVRDVARVLRPAGTYVVNIADGGGLGFARRAAATLLDVFDHAALSAEPGVLRGRRFGNLILAASRVPLPVAELSRRGAGGAFPARVIDADGFRGDASVLTDANPPAAPAPPSGLFGGPVASA